MPNLICPNCNTALANDEQFIIVPIRSGYTVDHVSIFSQGSTEILIQRKCSTGVFTTLSFGE